MKLRNDFTEITRAVYAFEVKCQRCNSNKCLELHHILGRCSNSILNSVLLCRECHQEYATLDKATLLQNTLRFLLREDYDMTEKDLRFYLKYKYYYDKEIL
jgi:hypothetical protein